MKFSMSTAWNDAMARLSGNREVLAVVAGVFFLLPALVLAVLFADEQAQAMQMMQQMMQGQLADSDPAALEGFGGGGFVAVSLIALFVQLIGYLALLALMDDGRRPTVGEAIGAAFKGLLPLIGTVILFIIGYFIIALVAGLVGGLLIGGLGAATGSTALVALLSVLFFAGLFVLVCWIMVRLSMTLAEIILGDTMNPIRAFAGSWRLTKGNSLRLFLFYFLLTLVYLVLYMVIFGLVFGVISLALPATASGLVLGLVSGLIGAAFGVIWTAVMAAVYRQLSGPSAGAIGQTFE
jgi:hypothetical protein